MKVQEIERKLSEAFQPEFSEVINESNQHNVPPGSESHFKVTLVSDRWQGVRKVQRHQSVYAVLADELAGPVHALALHLFTPEEWASATVPASPECLGVPGQIVPEPVLLDSQDAECCVIDMAQVAARLP